MQSGLILPEPFKYSYHSIHCNEKKMTSVTKDIDTELETPLITCSSFRNNKPLPRIESKYIISESVAHDPEFTITGLDVTDSDNYTIVANNGYLKRNYTYDLRVKGAIWIIIIYFLSYGRR